IGVFIFFIPIELNGKSTILLDHGSEWILRALRPLALTFIMSMMFYGGLSPFLQFQVHFRGVIPIIHIKAKNSFVDINGAIFSLFKLFGLLLSLLYLTGMAPEWMLRPDMLPFLFEKLAMAVGILIPLGSLALTFLLGFGLLEMAGVLMEKVMRPLFRTPGYSSVDAVTSFVGSYSIGLLITNRMYLRGRYSLRDAVITATGFSTVSATFMVVVAKTLGLMDHWNFYFWSNFLVTFVTTAITAYLPPIAGMDTQYGEGKDEEVKGKLLPHAITAGVNHYLRRPPLAKMLMDHLKEGLTMSSVVAPSILAVGFIGICIAKYTPLFEWLGYLLKPALMLAGMLLNLDNASASSGAIASGLAEMFLPSILLKDHGEVALRFIAAMTSVSSVLFFSGCIPCILATKIPVKVKDLLIIWLLRTLLSILLSSIMVWIGLKASWI
ncbi:MAG: YjiH family protein, partial [Enterobacteriaceae bacterium]